MTTRTSRRMLCALTLSLSAIAAGTSGRQAASDGPVQMTREEDHARTMKQLGLTTMPRGAAGNSVETYESKANPSCPSVHAALLCQLSSTILP